MFPLGSDLPTDTASLHAALTAGLTPLGAGVVAVEGDFPRLDSLAVSLNGARFHRGLGAPRIAGEKQPAFFARTLAASAVPAEFEGIPFHAAIRAEDAVFAFGRDSESGAVLVLERVGGGDCEFRVARADIEAALLALGRKAAEKQGAEIQRVEVTLTSESPRALALKAVVTAKAMFFTTTITASGRIEVSDALDATFHDFDCRGDGMLGNLAASFLRPKLAALTNRRIPLAGALGGVRLRDIAVSGGDALCVRARFGGA